MNPPERFPPDEPREWLNRAAGAYLEDMCFQAQQAAEKRAQARVTGKPR